MIFDRSERDVESAIKIRDEKVKFGAGLTQEEYDILERGFVTLNTINRIENKQKEIKLLINNIGYYNTPIVNRNWDENQYFLHSDLKRIVENNEILKKAYYVFVNTPTNANSETTFKNLNKIEQLLYDLEVMTRDMKSRFLKCGTFNCGG